MGRLLFLASIVGACLCQVAAANTVVVPFGDNSTSWGRDATGTPIVANPWAPPPATAVSPTVDTFGVPILDINGSSAGDNSASFTLNPGVSQTLDSITIVYKNTTASLIWDVLKPGDLFLDLDSNGGFDLVARTPYFASQEYFNADGSVKNAVSSTWNLFSLPDLPYLSDADVVGNPGGPYQTAGESSPASGGGWLSAQVRGYHPWALDSVSGLQSAGTATLSDGWDNLDGVVGQGQMTWTFDTPIDLPINQGTAVTIGWAPNCANDVLLDTIDTPGAVPEPSSLVVLAGLVGCGAIAMSIRKKRVNRKR